MPVTVSQPGTRGQRVRSGTRLRPCCSRMSRIVLGRTAVPWCAEWCPSAVRVRAIVPSSIPARAVARS
jgi:hypothetical protein